MKLVIVELIIPVVDVNVDEESFAIYEINCTVVDKNSRTDKCFYRLFHMVDEN